MSGNRYATPADASRKDSGGTLNGHDTYLSVEKLPLNIKSYLNRMTGSDHDIDDENVMDTEDGELLSYSSVNPDDISGPGAAGVLETCMNLLIMGNVLLAILIGCICASIFSRFLRWNV